LGSGGCSITDAISGYREWFSADELPVPASLEEYHEIVQTLLTDSTLNQAYRTRGYQAIVDRHTYAHRAQRVLELLGISLPASLPVQA
jgi:spore maturation protein CgeB